MTEYNGFGRQNLPVSAMLRMRKLIKNNQETVLCIGVFCTDCPMRLKTPIDGESCFSVLTKKFNFAVEDKNLSKFKSKKYKFPSKSITKRPTKKSTKKRVKKSKPIEVEIKVI